MAALDPEHRAALPKMKTGLSVSSPIPWDESPLVGAMEYVAILSLFFSS